MADLKMFHAIIEFHDVRIAVVEAEDMEAAQAKFDQGEWAEEYSIDFYSNSLRKPLTEGEPPQ